jgi:hypothetical protein
MNLTVYINISSWTRHREVLPQSYAFGKYSLTIAIDVGPDFLQENLVLVGDYDRHLPR